ncbi:MAG TPA: cache domain-containing protein [Candidatus Sulfotelmatobacter sp.]|nr:cache domain-containing protein [Candidatus Sulfotelmatobacter sp.]
MKLGLRTKIIGTLVIAMIISTAISAIAARQTMATDLNRLAAQQVTSGSTGFAGYWDGKRDAVKLLVTQAAIDDAVRRDTAARNGAKLSDTLSGIARQAGLSFLTVIDASGKVLARANGGKTGTTNGSPFVKRALDGETVSTAAVLPYAELDAEQLVPQIESTTSGKAGVDNGLAVISATPISDQNERTIGVVYGGIVMNHYYDVVDEAAHALGGKAAVLFDGQLISSSISRADGTRLVDEPVPAALGSTTTTWTGVDTEGGEQYIARVQPVLDDQNNVIAEQWFGVPLGTFQDIQSHTIFSLLLWGVVGILIGLLIGIPVVERISRQLIRRSGQVRASAKELSMVIVGSEVSGDHVAQTRAAIEREGELLSRIAAEVAPAGGGVATQSAVAETVGEASALNAEILGDVIVIDTLASEMAARTAQAVTRVNELNEVAAGLDQLVTGSK